MLSRPLAGGIESVHEAWTHGRPLTRTRRAEARLVAKYCSGSVGYQVPPLGQAPWPAVVQVRVGAAPDALAIVKSLPDFE